MKNNLPSLMNENSKSRPDQKCTDIVQGDTWLGLKSDGCAIFNQEFGDSRDAQQELVFIAFPIGPA